MDLLVSVRISILRRMKKRQSSTDQHGEGKPPSRKWLKIEMIARVVIALLSILVVVSIILAELVALPFFIVWETASLFVIVTFASLIYAPQLIYQYMARLHLDFLHEYPVIHQGTSALNAQLDELVSEIITPTAHRLISIVLAVLILAMGMYHFLLDGSDLVWEYAKVPILIFYALQIIRFFRIYPMLRRNIEQFEGRAQGRIR